MYIRSSNTSYQHGSDSKGIKCEQNYLNYKGIVVNLLELPEYEDFSRVLLKISKLLKISTWVLSRESYSFVRKLICLILYMML